MINKTYADFTEADETSEIVYLVGYLNTNADGERRIDIAKILGASLPITGNDETNPITGDVCFASSAVGLIISSPDGTKYRINVTNAGVLEANDISPG